MSPVAHFEVNLNESDKSKRKLYLHFHHDFVEKNAISQVGDRLYEGTSLESIIGLQIIRENINSVTRSREVSLSLLKVTCTSSTLFANSETHEHSKFKEKTCLPKRQADCEENLLQSPCF